MARVSERPRRQLREQPYLHVRSTWEHLRQVACEKLRTEQEVQLRTKSLTHTVNGEV